MILAQENKNLKEKIYGSVDIQNQDKFERDFDNFSNQTCKMSTGKLHEVIGNIQAIAI
jgi:hypothetical protein